MVEIPNPKSQIPNLKFYVLCLSFTLYALGFTLFCYAQEAQQNPPAKEAVEQVANKEEQAATPESLVASDNVTLDFKDVDIRNVLRIVSYKSGINVVATPEVMGNVTIRLVGVPWEKALDVILKTYGFGYEWLSNKVIMVSTLEKLSEQRKVQQAAQEMEPLDTQTFVLLFSKVEDIKTALEKLVSPRGKISLETRTNTLIITDAKTNLMRMGEIIKGLDRITPQVTIEAKIIETQLGTADKLGIDWTIKATASGSKRPTTVPFDAKGDPNSWMKSILPMGDTATTNVPTGYTYSFPLPKADYDKGAIRGDWVFGTLDFTQFQAVLEVLKSRTGTKILSNPRITTLNNQEATILVGKIVPIPIYKYSTETGTVVISGYDEKKVGIELTVTPNVNEQNYITLNIKPAVNEITSWTGPNNERPIISTRSAETKVMIKDGQTLVTAGLISEKKIKYKKKVPILGDIPVLDFFFSKKEDTVEKTELLIFITPRIVKEGMSPPEEVASLEQRLETVVKPTGKKR
jgi:type IV pilus assembly protein PilQ